MNYPKLVIKSCFDISGNSHSLPKASNTANSSLPNEYAALFASSPRTGARAGARFTDGNYKFQIFPY
jgi:hypothetical protein